MADKHMFEVETNPFVPWNIPVEALTQWLTAVALEEGYDVGSLNIRYYSDEGLLEINKAYLHHDYFTDIITFNRNRGKRLQGDLALSYERIIEHAKTFSKSITHEAARVHVHGILHLCGYKDALESEKQVMRDVESYYLEKAPTFGIDI
ncbi:MAG: hypothetical protein ABR98_07120 [Cryomorphaceae bacterium BACL7 MAG-120910-bin2]|jgi:probable rRNA maturation factor|nr:MAG: hypothetical protein ABR98_07120 [Cryomorphaceae bacterium BACL7 MAG-120910-bin2]KRO83052.1 MAG: hypothetical protein ABR87_03670 [Cryomorphaceae bacterium BACL7 MAG-121220-bin83]